MGFNIEELTDLLPELKAMAEEKVNEGETPAVLITAEKGQFILRVVACSVNENKKIQMERTLEDEGKPMSYDLTELQNMMG